ncbi:hypothetical protein ACH4U6_05170 [Streptomyces netropsis]|uniref:hypothetical protein n=1 Tax=Streptomyces netropsis TaxID=55404 RepID=UPI0037A21A7B
MNEFRLFREFATATDPRGADGLSDILGEYSTIIAFFPQDSEVQGSEGEEPDAEELL